MNETPESLVIWLRHAQILDSALPVGAFSHSFGLETFVSDGILQNDADLKRFLETALSGSWSCGDALVVKGAYCLEWDRLWELDALLDANRTARETREGQRKMGRAALKLARTIHPELEWAPLETATRSGLCPGSWPLVYGWWAREIGVSLDAAANGFLYGNCAATLNNAVRLCTVGQSAAQTILAQLAQEIPSIWNGVKARDPFDFTTSLPRLDIAQMQHQWLDSRLFMS